MFRVYVDSELISENNNYEDAVSAALMFVEPKGVSGLSTPEKRVREKLDEYLPKFKEGKVVFDFGIEWEIEIKNA